MNSRGPPNLDFEIQKLTLQYAFVSQRLERLILPTVARQLSSIQ